MRTCPTCPAAAGVSLNDGTVVAFGGMDVAQGVAAYGADVLVRRGAAFSAVDAIANAAGPLLPGARRGARRVRGLHVRRVPASRRRSPGAPRRRLAARAPAAPPMSDDDAYDWL